MLTRAIVAAACLAALGVCGCESDSKSVDAPPPVSPSERAPRDATITSVRQFREELLESQRQIDNVIRSLSDMTNPAQENLRDAYDRYADAVARVRQHEGTLQREAAAMRTARNAYFANWEGKAIEIDNPEIRASADARRSRLRAAHERIVDKSLAARDAYRPFMRDLQDVRRYLAPDLTRSAIADLNDAVPKVRASGVEVRDRIGEIVRELDAVQEM